MADPHFFKSSGRFTLEEIVKIAQAELNDQAHSSIVIKDLAPLSTAGSEEISFLDNPKYVEEFKKTKAGACIIDEKYCDVAPKGLPLVISKNPYLSNALVAAAFYPVSLHAEISEKAHISGSAKIGQHCTIEPGAYIGDEVEIGDDCYISANVNISHAIIGNNVIFHPGVCIGQDGFGFAFDGKKHIKVPQLGRVVIGNNVEIGANTCIDRGSGPDTTIGDGTKIDNLVQIAHNVVIGENCIITAQVGFAGSTVIEDYAMFGGQSGVAGHLTIGQGAQIAAQSGVTKNIKAGEVVCGMPAIPIKQFHRQAITLQHMTKKKDETYD